MLWIDQLRHITSKLWPDVVTVTRPKGPWKSILSSWHGSSSSKFFHSLSGGKSSGAEWQTVARKLQHHLFDIMSAVSMQKVDVQSKTDSCRDKFRLSTPPGVWRHTCRQAQVHLKSERGKMTLTFIPSLSMNLSPCRIKYHVLHLRCKLQTPI